MTLASSSMYQHSSSAKRDVSPNGTTGETPNKKPKPSIEKRWNSDAPGYNSSLLIDFLRVSKEFDCKFKQQDRGYAKVVDLETFTSEANKANFTMADIVATILYNYDVNVLRAFMDAETHPVFKFVLTKNGQETEFVVEKVKQQWKEIVTVRT